MVAKIELYKDGKGEFRWKLISSDGKEVAEGLQGYKEKIFAKNDIAYVMTNAGLAEVKDIS